MKENNVLSLIKEQSVFGFTGRINILLKQNKQHVGQVLQSNGLIVNSNFHGSRGKKALFNLLFEDIDGEADYVYVIEPELVKEDEISFKLSFEDLYKRLRSRFETYKEFKELRPPNHLKLNLRPEFIEDINGYSVGPEEFDTMISIVEYSSISEIYKNSPLYDYQITRALVSLRKKKALKVS